MAKKPPAMTVIAIIAVAAACTSAATPSPGETGPPSPTASRAEPSATPEPALPTTPSGYAELDQALSPDHPFEDRTVSIQTQWTGDAGSNFAASIADFAKATGITIQVDSIASSHESVLLTRITAGQPPDLAMLAQPTAVLDYGRRGTIIDVATFMDVTKLRTEHAATIGLVTDADKVWGIPYKVDVKSTVWYPIHYFNAKGFKVPASWDELITLSEAIKADGVAPWCMGMEAGTTTGWQATDWIEEVMLRTQPPEKYVQWYQGDLRFNSPEVRTAFEIVGQIFFTEGYVYGGNTAIVSTPQILPFDPAFPADDHWDGFKPDCAMHKFPTWYGPDFFPDVRANPGRPTKYEIGTDIGIFYLPKINDAQATPALGSADTLVVLADRPEVRAVAQFLSTPHGIQRWIEAGNAISANTTTPVAWYAGAYKLDVAAKIVNAASYVGFDASELMPGAVGAGAFPTESVSWINANGANLDQVLDNIDAAWPAVP